MIADGLDVSLLGMSYLGRLTRFELWEPAAAERRIEEARRAIAARGGA